MRVCGGGIDYIRYSFHRKPRYSLFRGTSVTQFTIKPWTAGIQMVQPIQPHSRQAQHIGYRYRFHCMSDDRSAYVQLEQDCMVIGFSG